MDSPHILPAQKIRTRRPRFKSQRNTIPITNQATFRVHGPRTTPTKATPMSRKPTIPLIPEHAETTLIGKERPLCTTAKSDPSPDSTGLATGTTRSTARRPVRVVFVDASRTRRSTVEYGHGQANRRYPMANF